MGRLLPVRHPNRDFFILDVSDASPKDDLASMEHPVFSLSVKPDMRELSYEHNGKRLRVVPSGLGLATIMDKDILLYCISKLVHDLNEGREITQWVEMTTHEAMVATNWNTGKRDYKRFEEALTRLRGTTLLTDVPTGDKLQTRGFGLIDEFEIDRKDEQGELAPFGRMARVRVKLSDWTFRAIKSMEVLTISQDYFRLRRPLERRIYELARKHVGDQDIAFPIMMANLQKKVGSNAPAKKFRFFVKQIVRDGHIPDYDIAIDGEKVIFRKRKKQARRYIGQVALKPETLDRAQKIAAEKGYSLAALEAEWSEWIAGKGMPESPDGSFIGFCKQKRSARQSSLFEG